MSIEKSLVPDADEAKLIEAAALVVERIASIANNTDAPAYMRAKAANHLLSLGFGPVASDEADENEGDE
jgi:hypothetical protein